MGTDRAGHGDRRVTADLRLAGDGWELRAKVTVPAGPTTPAALLPTLQSLAGAIADSAARAVEEAGAAVSCRAGCSACCRQLVPVSAAEAAALRAHLDSLPEPRRSGIRRRFADAEERFREAGILEALLSAGSVPEEDGPRFRMAYFLLGVACPFLEDDRCSVYEMRPMVCREFLVTSPAERCADVNSASVEPVPMPLHPASAFLELVRPAGSTGPAPWVPLALALHPACVRGPEAAERTGPQLLEDYFRLLTGGTAPEDDGRPR